jgi:hypothetical protein
MLAQGIGSIGHPGADRRLDSLAHEERALEQRSRLSRGPLPKVKKRWRLVATLAARFPQQAAIWQTVRLV